MSYIHVSDERLCAYMYVCIIVLVIMCEFIINQSEQMGSVKRLLHAMKI
jgi:hypothetical protein